MPVMSLGRSPPRIVYPIRCPLNSFSPDNPARSNPPVGCKVVEHAGAKFALLQMAPDRGNVVLTAGAAGDEKK